MVRNDNFEWTEEALEFKKSASSVLRCLFQEYKNKLSIEDIYYITCFQLHDLILEEVCHEKLLKNKNK